MGKAFMVLESTGVGGTMRLAPGRGGELIPFGRGFACERDNQTELRRWGLVGSGMEMPATLAWKQSLSSKAWKERLE